MKKLLFLVAILPLCAMVANATNQLVLDGACNCLSGGSGQYTTIAGAVAAASGNDTIFVKNTTSNTPRAESFTINKSLVFAPYYDNAQINANTSVDTGGIYCSGVWTITGAPGMTVTIIGLNNVNGQVIASGGTQTAANRCYVRILGSNIINNSYNSNGTVYFNVNNYDLLLEGTKVSTNIGTSYSVIYQHGSIIGDSIFNYSSASYPALYCATDASASTDTSFIIGNMIIQATTSSNISPLYWYNNTTMFDIRNNMIIDYDYATAGSAAGIFMYETKQTTNINKIYNNTIFCNSITNNGLIGIYGYNQGGNTSVIEIQNNLIVANSTATSGNRYGIALSSASWTVNTYYNYIDSKFATAPLSASVSINSNNNVATVLSSTITAGWPNMNIDYGTGATPTGGTWTAYTISQAAAAVAAYGPGYSGTTAATTSFGYPIQSVATLLVNKGNPANSFCDLVPGPTSTSPTYVYPYNTVGCYGGPYSIQQFFAPPAANINTGSVGSPTYVQTTYYGLNAIPARTFMTPSMFSNVMLSGATIPTGSFRAASFDR